MILPPGEPQALKDIENQLSGTDPGLAAVLREFDAAPGRVRARVHRERIRYIVMMALLWALLALCVTMIALTAL